MSADFNNCGFIQSEPDFKTVTMQNQNRSMCNLVVCFDSVAIHSTHPLKSKKKLCLHVAFWDDWAIYARMHLRTGVKIQIEGELKITKNADGVEYAHITGRRFFIDGSILKKVCYEDSVRDAESILAP